MILIQDYTRVGKFLSLILRHNPETIGITLDKNGWADVSDLIAGVNKKGYKLDIDILSEIVETNNKKRYIFNQDKTKIRANQGHSIKVDVELKKQTPPNILYHGTAKKYYDLIIKDGIQKKSRNHVHLSKDEQTAITVGKRHGESVVIKVNAKVMDNEGYEFFVSENGVWLVDFVPARFLS